MESIGDCEYSKKDLIGHGAFAVVFKGRHKKKHDFVVAIKCITKKNLAKSQSLLSKEIKILKELSDLHHENVVALLDCKETSHHVYLVMEYCNGGDLADYLQVKGTLSEDTIALFLKQIAGAMKALNAKGIVHRDMKPQNILLTHSGNRPNPPAREIQLKIADFGFARFLQDGVMAATLCGSPMYMAPEVIMSLQYDAKADLWSIGTIIYQCLTGKAPFQAQTPHQLKQFYEKNPNLQPNIPAGTSPDLRDLLMGMLRRNAKDRIDFDTFFNHQYLNPKPKSSSPVPVPRSRSRSSLGESPNMKTVSASPLSGNLGPAPSPPHPPVIPRRRDSTAGGQEPMEVGSPSTGYVRVQPVSPKAPVPPRGPAALSPRATLAEQEDFVLVPENVPSEPSSAGSDRRPPSACVDLNAIFSDNSPDSPKHVPKTVRATPYSQPPRRASTGTAPPRSPTSPEGSPLQTSPSRPSTLPGTLHTPPGTPPGSQPIPVPSQVKAYEQIQRSIQGLSPSSSSPRSPPSKALLTPPAAVAAASQGVPIPPRRVGSNSSLASVGSMSPPSVQFTIGTPPSSSWKRTVAQPTAVAAAGGSPLRKPGAALPKMCTVPAALNQLPPIVGSPTKAGVGLQPAQHPPFGSSPINVGPLGQLAAGQLGAGQLGAGQFGAGPLGAGQFGGGVGALGPLMMATEEESPTKPLSTPFASGRPRAKTCPDYINAVGYSPDEGTGGRLMSERSSGGESDMQLERSRSSGRLSDQLLIAAFGGQLPSPPLSAGFLPAAPPPSSNMIVPYGGSSSSLSRAGSNTSLSRVRRPSSSEADSPSSLHYLAQSPPNMEGPISFVAPELAEETLMDREHNETVAKLNFILALVECIIELAQSRSSPITQSMTDKQQQQQQAGGQQAGFTLDHVAFMSESQRRLEQLVLYVRALQLLTSSIQLAKDEVKARRLQPSNSVKTILKDMNNYYHQCLVVCKNLHGKGPTSPDADTAAAAVTADKLIYTYAIDMCQTAALDELFGNPQECFRRYRNAQILLHSLAQQAQNDTDRALLNKYREAVEKRLFNLQSQGYIQAFEASMSS